MIYNRSTLPASRFIPALLVATGLATNAAHAAADPEDVPSEPDRVHEPDSLFQDSAVLNVTIDAPFATIVKERPREEYLTGTLTYVSQGDKAISLDIGIRTRGNDRHENCQFPPLRLNFKKSQTEGTLFEHQDKLKLVVHCHNVANRNKQSVLREYIAYRILNTLTDLSFKVRLLHVHYVDSDARRSDTTRYAFLIEHKDRLAKRTLTDTLEIDRTRYEDLQANHLNLTALFQYLIGNTDFSPIASPPGENCCHNYQLFLGDEGRIYSIPYDFDRSGIVNTAYATPSPRFNLRNVRQRLYRGRCANNTYLPENLRSFQEQRNVIFGLIERQAELNPQTRKYLQSYVEGFFKIIDDPDSIERRISEKCI